MTADPRRDSGAPRVRSYRDLRAWQAAVEAAVACHRAADRMGRGDRAGLAAQIRRAAASVPANIAEGHGRLSRGEYVRFLSIANGSLREVESHLTLAVRLDLLNPEDAREPLRLTAGTSRLLLALIRRLRRGA